MHIVHFTESECIPELNNSRERIKKSNSMFQQRFGNGWLMNGRD